MSNIISLASARLERAPASTRDSILATLEKAGVVFIGGANPIGKIEAMRLERAGLLRIEEYRSDGTSRVMLPVEFEPKTREETSVWMLFPRHDWRGFTGSIQDEGCRAGRLQPVGEVGPARQDGDQTAIGR